MVPMRNLLLELKYHSSSAQYQFLFPFLLTKILGHIGICEKSLDNLHIGI
jgi:hypothetical protein